MIQRVKELLCHIIYTLKSGNVYIKKPYGDIERNKFLVNLTHFFEPMINQMTETEQVNINQISL